MRSSRAHEGRSRWELHEERVKAYNNYRKYWFELAAAYSEFLILAAFGRVTLASGALSLNDRRD